MISTPPGSPAFTRAHIPLLAPPFDDSDGLQSNARFNSYSTSTKPRTPQVGLGLLFAGSDFLPHLDGPPTPAVDPLLDSPQLTAAYASPAEPFRLSVPESSSCAADEAATAAGTALDASSSAFSIRDWIIQPSSSPVPSEAPSIPPSPSPPHPRQVELTHNASFEPTNPHADVDLLNTVSTLPGTPASFNPAVLAVPLARPPLANTDGPCGSAEKVFYQVVERLYLGRVPSAGCLSPGRTSIPGRSRDCTSPYVTEAANPQPLDITYYESDFRIYGERFSTSMDASGGFTGANLRAAGSALMSPRNPLSSNSNDALVSPDTPMFNMHQGVSECDLQRRANRYRRRYPGRSLDRHWLSRYAGKLNKDGKAIEEYRCYISGCAQLNKRRDHIIVHICSHVNERPFACCHWYYFSSLL